MPDAHANFAYSLVTVAPAPAASGLSLTVADGSVYPTAPFNAVVCPVGVLPLAANAEIIRVTNNAAGVLTILRQQEGTAARSILVGDSLFAAITAKTLTDAELPPQWSKDDATGTITGSAEPGETALVLDGDTTADTPAIIINAGRTNNDGQTLFSIRDITAVQSSHLEGDGGGGFAYDRVTISELGQFHVAAQVPINPPFSGATPFTFANNGTTLVSVNMGGGYGTVIGGLPTDVLLEIDAAGGQTSDLFRIYDESYTAVTRVTATGVIVVEAPNPGDVALTLVQTDEDTPLLDLRGAPLSAFNAESLLRVIDVDYDEPIMDIDTGGNIFGYKAASDPDPLHGFILSREGRVILKGNSTTTPGNSAHIQFEWDGLTVFAVQPHGTLFVVNARDPADNAFQVNAAPGQTANIFEAWTDDLRFRLDKDARLVTSVHSAPADADLAAGECSLWFDDTDGAAKLKIKAKSADGTVVAGEVALA